MMYTKEGGRSVVYYDIFCVRVCCFCIMGMRCGYGRVDVGCSNWCILYHVMFMT